MYEFDLKLVYVRLSEAQRFFHLGRDINRIELQPTGQTYGGMQFDDDGEDDLA